MAGRQVGRSLDGRIADWSEGEAPARASTVVVALRGSEAQPAFQAMARHPLFSGLTVEQRQRLLQVGRVEQFVAGQLVYSRGEPSTRFYLVLEGQINLSLHSREGVEKIVDLLGPGEVFAEAVAFMVRPVYQLTAIAASRARVLAVPNQDYVETLLANPAACRRALQHLSTRLHVRIREIEGITLESATSRVAHLLDERLPATPAEGGCIRLTETRQELASYLAMKPETLSRALRALADHGAIVVKGRTIEVLSRARLCAHFDEA